MAGQTNIGKFTISIKEEAFREAIGASGSSTNGTWLLWTSNLNKLNFSNHDATSYLHRPHSLSNWSILPGGSIPYEQQNQATGQYRTDGNDYWAEEELNYVNSSEAVRYCQPEVPRTKITHDAPHEVLKLLFGIDDKMTTLNAL